MDAYRRGVIEGLPVYSSDGEKMGKVIRCGSTAFEIEKGFFFPKDYMISYNNVTGVDDGRVTLNLTKVQLKERWERADLLGDRAGAIDETAPIGYTTAEEVRRSEEAVLQQQRAAEQEALHREQQAERQAIQSSAPSDTYRDVVPAQSKFQHERHGEVSEESQEYPISHRDFREREAGIYAGGEPKEPLNVGTITEAEEASALEVDQVTVREDLTKPQLNKDEDYKF